jgi:hypothetical protein
MSPTLVRSFHDDKDAEKQLEHECRIILSSIAGFQYWIERGFFHWSATAPGGTTSGVLSHDCFSDEFQIFQRDIVQRQPVSFEDIEGALR